MQPLFPEFIQFINDKNNEKINDPLIQNNESLWIDRNFIVGITKEGQVHKLYKYIVDDNLNLSVIKHKEYKKNLNFETWNETIKRNEVKLNSLIAESLSIINNNLKLYPDHMPYILNSTGKDSIVVTHLCQMLKPDMKVMFNNTSMEDSATYKIVKSHKDWIITNPSQGFYNWVKETNIIPTRFSRACCRIFKEGNMINSITDEKALFIMGIRNDESTNRKDRKDIDKNPEWKDRDWYSLNPIRKWDELSIWLYILKNNLEINPKYKQGYKRVGCSVVCPYASKYNWILDEYWYPKKKGKMVKDFRRKFY